MRTGQLPQTADLRVGAGESAGELLVRRIDTVEPETPVAEMAGGLRAEIVAGLRFVWHQPLLRRIVVTSSIINLIAAASEVAYLIFLVRDLQQGGAVVGLALSAGGVGAVLGALTSHRITAWLGDGRALWVPLACTAPFGLLLPLAQRDAALLLVVPALLFPVIGLVVYDIVQLSLRQSLTPAAMQGRVHATVRFSVSGSLPLGSVLGGFFASVLGARPALWALAVASLLTPLLLAHSGSSRWRVRFPR